MAESKEAVAQLEHPPITNIFTDRVLTYTAFVEFLKSRLETIWGTTWINNGMIEILHVWATNIVGEYRNVPSFRGNLTDPRFDMLEAYLSQVTRNRVRGARRFDQTYTITEQNWRIIRDAIRYSHSVYTTYLTDKPIRPTTDYVAGPDGVRRLAGARSLLPYFQQLFSDYNVDLNPFHFVHVSPTDPSKIRFTPNQKAWEKDVTTETTIAKYLKKHFPELTDLQLRDIATIHKLACTDGGLEFFTKKEDLIRVYRDGPGSCMTHGDEKYGGHEHPLAVYAEMPGIRLAALRSAKSKDGDGKGYSARCFVYENPDDPDDKRYIRVYGDTRLMTILQNRGYEAGNWSGAKLRKIPALDRDGHPIPDTWIAPYIDDVSRGTSYNNQYVTSRIELDYWVVGNNSTDSYMPNYNQHLAFINSGGLSGDFHAYNPVRHNFWRARIEGRPYTPPSLRAPNEFSEVLCFNCREPFELPYVERYRTRDGLCYVCRSCFEELQRERHVFRLEEPLDDAHIVQVGLLAAVPNDEREAIHVGSAIPELDRTRLSNFTIVPISKLAELGWVRLHQAYYERAWKRRNDDVVMYRAEWYLKKDLITTVFNTTDPRFECFFLGQNFNEEMQYFPCEGPLRDAVTRGRFFVVGSKIAYDPNGEFRPIERRKVFELIGELGEDDDDLPVPVVDQLPRTPLIEVLNTLWSAATVEYCGVRIHEAPLISTFIRDCVYGRLHSLWPRVDARFLIAIIDIYHKLKTDEYAGIEGISSLAPQLSNILAQPHFSKPFTKFGARKKRRPTATFTGAIVDETNTTRIDTAAF